MDLLNKEKHPNKIKQPWPTKAAMEQIYNLKLWGDNDAPFYSGEGSHSSQIINPYIEKLSAFFSSFQNQLIVVDLGCGDFNIGKSLFANTKKYIGVDIVEDLINYNNKTFQHDKLDFLCLDIAVDELPNGDCAILRQVLQHLSNDEIDRILLKLKKYKFIILTEHIPIGEFTPNKSIISGQGIRLKHQSGVDIMAPPFNFEVIETNHLHTFNLDENKGRIVTTLYQTR